MNVSSTSGRVARNVVENTQACVGTTTIYERYFINLSSCTVDKGRNPADFKPLPGINHNMLPVFARPKPCRIMIALRDTDSSWHLSKLARTSNTTYVYVTKLVAIFHKNGLVIIEPKGKKRIVRLTDKGMAVANTIHELMNKLEG